jgi:hypothetical protein
MIWCFDDGDAAKFLAEAIDPLHPLAEFLKGFLARAVMNFRVPDPIPANARWWFADPGILACWRLQKRGGESGIIGYNRV